MMTIILSLSGLAISSRAAPDPGSLVWEKRYNGPANSTDAAQALALDAAGRVAITGFSRNTNGNVDYYTAKYAAADGFLLWERRYNGLANRDDEALAVAVDRAGNVVVTGYSESVEADYYTAKYAAADGALLWERRYSGPAGFDDVALAVAVDNADNIIVTGYSRNAEGNSDYYTAKYAAANGALLWERRYNGPANRSDEARDLAVDSAGNVVVTGHSFNNGTFDYYTAKYAAADGALLWERRYNGPANSTDVAQAVALDGAGNVVVTGSSYNLNRNADYYTAKYAAVDGALLWERRYNGPANLDDFAFAVAIDSTGNVAVTGGSTGIDTSYDYYTAKYAAVDGALQWERRYNGIGDLDDAALDLAVDSAGNVVVTGESTGYETDYDMYTAKYSAASGAVVWEVRYNGPSSFVDSAQAVAVDGAGNVVVTGYSTGVTGSDDVYTAKYYDAVSMPARPPYGLYLRGNNNFTNFRGQQERYFGGTSSLNGYNDPNGYWYYILPDGALYEFTPPYSNPALTGVLVAQLGSAYYNNPQWLTYSLFQRDGSYFTNFRGQQEKYLGGTTSANGYNDPNGYWYYILRNGDLYEFTPPYSNPALTGVLIARLGAAYYDHPRLVPYRFYQRGGSYFTNVRGQQEKYLGGLVSASGYNDPDGYWYYILPNGDLYEFTPPYSNPALSGVLLEQLGPAIYNDPSLLLTNRVQVP